MGKSEEHRAAMANEPTPPRLGTAARMEDAGDPCSRSRPPILLIVSDLGQGGTQTTVCRLANAWSRAGRRVRLLALLTRTDGTLDIDPAVEQVPLSLPKLAWLPRPPRSLWRVVQWIAAIRREIVSSRPQLVLSFLTSVNVLVLLACLGLHGLRVVVCERRDPARQKLAWRWTLLAKLLYRKADLVTANSRGAVATLAGFVPQQKVAWVPNLLPRRDDDVIVHSSSPLIVIVGRLAPEKGHDLLFQAFSQARSDLTGWRIAILGDGPSRKDLAAMAERLGISQAIDWHGHVADPYPYYRAAKICVVPSRFEGMPNALLEAMSCGLPAIVSDASPGPLELISHERNGLIFRSEDSDALSRGLVRLARDAEFRSRLGAAAKETAAMYDQDRAILEWNRVVGLSVPGEPG